METNQTATPIYANYESRKEIRNSAKFKALGNLWDSTDNRTIRVIGPLMKLMKDYNPQTFEEWKQVYLTHGRSWEQIQEQAARWAVTAEITIDEAIAHVVIHAIDETWEGARGEHLALELLQKEMPDFSFELADNKIDTNYSIDIIVTNSDDGVIVGGIQVKPASYFYKNFHYNKNDKGQNDKDRYNDNMKRFAADFGAIVYYINLGDVKKDILRLIPLSKV